MASAFVFPGFWLPQALKVCGGVTQEPMRTGPPDNGQDRLGGAGPGEREGKGHFCGVHWHRQNAASGSCDRPVATEKASSSALLM